MKDIKLNLGAGNDHRKGWINADIDPTTNPDQIIDLSKKLPFKDGQIDEILLQDVLEHFTKLDGEKLLKEIRRILKPKAKLTLRVPNVYQVIEQFKDDPQVLMEFVYGTTDQNGVWGAHKHGFDAQSLKETLILAGFDNIEITTETTNFVARATKSTRLPPKPSILVIQQAPDWGGAEEWMLTLVKNWRSQKLSVTCVTNLPKLQKAFRANQASVINLPFVLDIIGNLKGLIKSTILLPYALWWYVRLLSDQRNKGINVIVMSGFSEKMLVTWLAKLFQIPVIWFEYGPLTTVFRRNLFLPKIIYRLTNYLPKKIITISNSTKQNLIIDGRVSLAKLALIPPGVEIPLVKISQTNHHPITIGHLSRITPEKGQRLLLSAFKIVLKKYPKARLKIAGSGPDEAFLKQQVRIDHIEHAVDFLGFIEDKNKFYQSIDLFVFPGSWAMEGFGIVMIEALAHGLPVAAVNSGPTSEVIKPSVGALSSNDPESLSKAILKLLGGNPTTYRSKAHHFAKEHFNATIQAQKVTNYVQDAVTLNAK